MKAHAHAEDRFSVMDAAFVGGAAASLAGGTMICVGNEIVAALGVLLIVAAVGVGAWWVCCRS